MHLRKHRTPFQYGNTEETVCFFIRTNCRLQPFPNPDTSLIALREIFL